MTRWELGRVLIIAGLVWVFLALIFPQMGWFLLLGGAMVLTGAALAWTGRDRADR